MLRKMLEQRIGEFADVEFVTALRFTTHEAKVKMYREQFVSLGWVLNCMAYCIYRIRAK